MLATAHSAPPLAPYMNQPRDPAELSRLSGRVIELRMERRDLDGAIERLQADMQAASWR